MKEVVFLGSKSIGYECFKILIKNQKILKFKIKAVLTNKKRSAELLHFCNENNIRVLNSLEEYLSLENVDIAISVQYHEILKLKHIEKAKDITINLHMAPLPEYRGCNQFSYAIINEDKEFGTTIHRLEEGIDSGQILFEKRFPRKANSWGSELYDLTFQKSIELFTQSLKKIITGDYTLTSQESLLSTRACSIHYRSEINSLKKLDLNWDIETISRYVRATYMPGFPPPYIILQEKKFFLEMEKVI